MNGNGHDKNDDLEKEAKEVEAMKGDAQGEKQSENGWVEDDV